MSADRTHLWRVRTPEGVALRFRLASPVLRAGALMIDWAAVTAAWAAVATGASLLKLVSADAEGMAVTIGYFIFSQGYWIATEWLWRGQSLGKRVLRLRVVDAGGRRLTLAQVGLRNALRFVDGLPVFYLVGGVAALVSARGQRLGDLAADTLVVWEPAEAAPNLAALEGGEIQFAAGASSGGGAPAEGGEPGRGARGVGGAGAARPAGGGGAGATLRGAGGAFPCGGGGSGRGGGGRGGRAICAQRGRSAPRGTRVAGVFYFTFF